MVISPQSGGEPRRLYSEVTYGKYTVLALGALHAEDSIFTGATSRYSILHSSSETSISSAKPKEKVYKADWVDSNESTFVVVRPDMYIGYVGDNMDACNRHLRNVLCQELQ